MATHPVESEDSDAAASDTGAPNPTRLPVEPEFGPMPPAAEPEDPVAHHPQP